MKHGTVIALKYYFRTQKSNQGADFFVEEPS